MTGLCLARHKGRMKFAPIIFAACAVAHTVACSDEKRPPEVPIGTSPAPVPVPVVPVKPIEPVETRATSSQGTNSERADTSEHGAEQLDPPPYFTLCDLPDHAPAAPMFSSDSTALRPRGKEILDQIAHCMLHGELMNAKIAVIGYADPRGGREYNLELAADRAVSARRYLIHRGVPPHRVTVASRGEHYSRGIGPESWQLDRRVEFIIVEDDED